MSGPYFQTAVLPQSTGVLSVGVRVRTLTRAQVSVSLAATQPPHANSTQYVLCGPEPVATDASAARQYPQHYTDTAMAKETY